VSYTPERSAVVTTSVGNPLELCRGAITTLPFVIATGA
jgi:hypothetical protein